MWTMYLSTTFLPTNDEDSSDESYNEWPTNAATITCTSIDIILFIITTIIYTCLCTKSRNHLKIQDQIERPNSVKSHRDSMKRGELPTQNHQSHQIIRRKILYLTLISCTFLFISNLITVIYTLNSQYYICCARIITFIQIITIGMGKVFCHFIFIRRLYVTFKSSNSLAYPSWIFYTLYSLGCIGILVCIAAVIFIAISHNDKFLYIAAAGFAGDFIASIVILLLFIHKLYQVFMSRKKMSVRDVEKPIEFGNPDKQLLGTMTKLTLLSSLSALSALFLFILFQIRTIEETDDDGEGYEIWKIVYVANVFLMLSALVNIMALYLVLPMANDHYHLYCKCLHELIERCCQVGMKDELGKQRRKWIQTSLEMNVSKMEVGGFSDTELEEKK